MNSKNNANYLEAQDILKQLDKHKGLVARSPKKYFGKLWGSKGIMIFLTSILSAIVLAEAMLVFDLASFLSYCFTVVMGVVMGYLQMRQTEDYWTSEYLAYAKDELSKYTKEQERLAAEELERKANEAALEEEIAVVQAISVLETNGGILE